jgi:hypothetical protein
MAGWWRPVDGGLALTVRLTPKGGRDAVDGVAAGADGREYLKARVAAAPEDGKANGALVALIAAKAGVGRSAVSVTAGHAARVKTLHIACPAGQRGDIAGRIARPGGGETQGKG